MINNRNRSNQSNRTGDLSAILVKPVTLSSKFGACL